MTAYELADRLDRNVWGGVHPDIKKCSDMLRQQADRIAELEKVSSKPVAWMYERLDGSAKVACGKMEYDSKVVKEIPLYTHLHKQLSDERIAEIWEYAKQTALNTRGGIVELIFSRAIIKEITE